MPLAEYISGFQALNVNRAGGHASPRKGCMLLAVMDLLVGGSRQENRIEFSEGLVDKFRHHFEMMQTTADQLNPHLPYYHLKSDGFWHHALRPGAEAAYENLRNTTSAARVRDSIAHAYLDDELFN